MLICSENKLMPIFGTNDKEFVNLLLPKKYVTSQKSKGTIIFILLIMIIVCIMLCYSAKLINTIFFIGLIISCVLMVGFGIKFLFNDENFFIYMVILSIIIFVISIIMGIYNYCAKINKNEIYGLSFLCCLIMVIILFSIYDDNDKYIPLKSLFKLVIAKNPSYMKVIQQFLNEYVKYCEFGDQYFDLTFTQQLINSKYTMESIIKSYKNICPFIEFIRTTYLNSTDNQIQEVANLLIINFDKNNLFHQSSDNPLNFFFKNALNTMPYHLYSLYSSVIEHLINEYAKYCTTNNCSIDFDMHSKLIDTKRNDDTFITKYYENKCPFIEFVQRYYSNSFDKNIEQVSLLLINHFNSHHRYYSKKQHEVHKQHEVLPRPPGE